MPDFRLFNAMIQTSFVYSQFKADSIVGICMYRRAVTVFITEKIPGRRYSREKSGFSGGYGVDVSAGFYVFSLVVSAHDFRGACSGGADKIDLFEAAKLNLGGDHVGDLLEIVLMVCGDIDAAAGFEAADGLLDVFSTDKSSFMVAFLRPGVRKVDMKATD